MMSNAPVILVVEDDMEMNDLQRELLALHGMDAIPAFSGVDALRIVSERPVNAILLDIMLPEMDGFETCQRFRQQENSRDIPIVMLTALDTEECREKGFAAGADAYFIKPFNPEEVIESLQQLMADSEANR